MPLFVINIILNTLNNQHHDHTLESLHIHTIFNVTFFSILDQSIEKKIRIKQPINFYMVFKKR